MLPKAVFYVVWRRWECCGVQAHSAVATASNHEWYSYVLYSAAERVEVRSAAVGAVTAQRALRRKHMASCQRERRPERVDTHPPPTTTSRREREPRVFPPLSVSSDHYSQSQRLPDLTTTATSVYHTEDLLYIY